MEKRIIAIIFAGAIWGIAEGTIGWVLHMLHVPHVGLWLSPVIVACVIFAFKATGKASSVFFAALVAALIKCTDLLLPISVPLYYVLHPAIYILAEGLVGALVIRALNFRQVRQLKFATSTAVSCLTLVAAVAVNLVLCACR